VGTVAPGRSGTVSWGGGDDHAALGPSPRPGGGRRGHAVGEWELRSPIDLTVSPGQLRDVALRTPPSARIGFDDLQRLLLAFEELAANGLRHGRASVQVRVVGTGECWFIDVSDAAVSGSPTPVTGPDLAHGDFGLYLAAGLCPGHGWSVCRGRRHVWGCLRPA
jgi:hypothetical protein